MTEEVRTSYPKAKSPFDEFPISHTSYGGINEESYETYHAIEVNAWRKKWAPIIIKALEKARRWDEHMLKKGGMFDVVVRPLQSSTPTVRES